MRTSKLSGYRYCRRIKNKELHCSGKPLWITWEEGVDIILMPGESVFIRKAKHLYCRELPAKGQILKIRKSNRQAAA